MLEQIISSKKTRLCFSADFKNKKELIKWIHIVGPHICILKTHIDILEDFDENLIDELIKLKEKYNFLIFEDRKFSDIGKIFHSQLYGGIYKIARWADIITIHGVCCNGMLSYLNDKNNSPKVLIVSEMSSEGNLIDENYTNNCYKMGLKYKNIVIGFICQKKFVDDNNFMFLTPGINLENGKEKDQNYKTPEEAFKNGTDVIIVGSGIYSNLDPKKIILKYK